MSHFVHADLCPEEEAGLLRLGVSEQTLLQYAAEREETPTETANWLLTRYAAGTVPLIALPFLTQDDSRDPF